MLIVSWNKYIEFETPYGLCGQQRLAAYHLRASGLSEEVSSSISRGLIPAKKGLAFELPLAVELWLETEGKNLIAAKHNIKEAKERETLIASRVKLGKEITFEKLGEKTK